MTQRLENAAVRIPEQIMADAGLREGDNVTVEVESPGVIVIRSERTERTLDSFVSQISADNQHSEADWGTAVGHEIW